jgi:hypothetical protein
MRQLRNPFYVLLMVVGVVFTITMCAYAVMTVRLGQSAEPPPTEGLMWLLSEHGLAIIVVELAVLGLATVLAISTDEYWTGGEEAPPEEESDEDRAR